MRSYSVVSLAIFCLFSVGSSFAMAQTDQCAALSAGGMERSSEIKARYQGRIDQITTDTKQQADQLAADGPDPDNAVEGAIKFDLDFSSHDEEIIFHLPEVTIKDQALSIDLPQVTMKTQDWIFHTPSTRMETQCTPGLPETVCKWVTRDIGLGIKTDIYECYMRAGSDICLDVPVIFMEEQRISLDVPEVTMDTVEIVMGIPEVTMKENRMVITVPDITVKDVEAEISETRQKGQELASRSKEQSQTLSTQMKAELDQVALDSIKESYTCQMDSLNLKRTAALGEIDKNISAITGGLEAARASGATQIADSNERALASLVANRDKVIAMFDEAAATMTSQMEGQLGKASQAGLAVAILPATDAGGQAIPAAAEETEAASQ